MTETKTLEIRLADSSVAPIRLPLELVLDEAVDLGAVLRRHLRKRLAE